MKIVTSAPTKVILTGEHAVVHGAPAVAMPIERKNRVTLHTEPGVGVEFREKNHPEWHWTWKPGVGYEGQPVYRGLYDMTEHILKECGTSFDKLGHKLKAELQFSYSPKGTGNSASIAAAWAHAVYAAVGAKPSMRQLFDAVQVAEKVAHGSPSGIDARTVLSSTAQRFQKSWDATGKVSFKFSDLPLHLPQGTVLFLAQTPLAGEPLAATAELVERFAKNVIGKKPAEFTAADRQKAIAPFQPVIEGIIRELHESGNPIKLGELFTQNHAVLSSGGVVPPAMQEVIDIALTKGALGAKGTGACGPGGAVLIYCHEKDQKRILHALKSRGITAVHMPLAERGAGVESREG